MPCMRLLQEARLVTFKFPRVARLASGNGDCHETQSTAQAAPAVSSTRPFFGNAIKPPISAGLTGTGNSSVFRHTVLRAGYFFYEAGPSSASFKSGRHSAETPVDLGAEPTRIPCSVLVDWFILLSELPTGAGAVNGRAHLFMRRRPFSYAGLRASNPVELSSIPLNTNINFGL